MHSVYFSCPKFTVRLVVRANIIQEAAPIAKRFEEQPLDALTLWAESKFGRPIIIQRLSAYAPVRSEGTRPRPGRSVGER